MIDTPSTTATATWSRPLSQALAYCHQDCIAFGLSCYLIKSGAAVRRGAPDSHPTESTNWIRLGPAIKYDLLTGYWLRRMRCVYTLDLWPAFFFLSLPPPPAFYRWRLTSSINNWLRMNRSMIGPMSASIYNRHWSNGPIKICVQLAKLATTFESRFDDVRYRFKSA